MPAVIVVGAVWRAAARRQLLVLSQVVLSLQLPFAVIPLVQFTSDRAKDGAVRQPALGDVLAWAVAAVIVGLNAKLLFDVVSAELC